MKKNEKVEKIIKRRWMEGNKIRMGEKKGVDVAEGYFCPDQVILEAIKSGGLVLQYWGIFVPFDQFSL